MMPFQNSSSNICLLHTNICKMYTTMKTLLTENQTLLLRLFYTNPDKSFFIHEIGRILGKKPGVFQRTLYNLEKEGVLKSSYQANARFFQVNADHPLYPEFKKIISKTVGASELLRQFLGKIKDARLGLIYGSFAKETERKDSDIDLLVVGHREIEGKLLRNLPAIEKSLQREINYKLYTENEFKKKRKAQDPFLDEILEDKYILLKGEIADV